MVLQWDTVVPSRTCCLSKLRQFLAKKVTAESHFRSCKTLTLDSKKLSSPVFVVFWTLHGNAKYLVMMFMDKKSNVVFETHLLHARHLQVNLDGCGATLFFLDVHVVCQQQQTNLFFCQTAFYIFWKLRDVFQLFHGQGERFWNL